MNHRSRPVAASDPGSPRSWVGVLLASLLVGLLAVLSWHLPALYGEQGVERVQHDPLVYERYCREIAEGHVPYRDFRVEYPPLAIPIWLGALCPLEPAGNVVRPDAGDRDGRGERGADARGRRGGSCGELGREGSRDG